MKSSQHHNSEKGQALVLIVLAILAMLGFAALAIDGGMVYTDRRQAQNAADTAALAGALSLANTSGHTVWRVGSSADLKARAVAMERAKSNGYDNNQTSNWVTVNHPPQSGPYKDNLEYIQVFIRSKVNTSFAHMVYSGPLENIVESVAHAKPGSIGPMYNGQALTSLGKQNCGLTYGGNSTTVIVNSGIFVNSPATGNHDALCNSGGEHGGGSITLNDPNARLTVVGDSDNATSLYPSSALAPDQSQAMMNYPPDELLRPPLPTDLNLCQSEATVDGSDMTAGSWSPGPGEPTFPPSGITHLRAGIYCIDGDLKITGNDPLTSATKDEGGILLYVKGSIEISGSSEIIDLQPYQYDPFKNMLIYVDPENYDQACLQAGTCTVNDVTINGNSTTNLYGTIYAPASDIKLNGSDTFTVHSQVIGGKVELTGSGTITIDYQADENHQENIPASVETSQ